MARWKIKFNGKYFIFRSLASTAIGQLALSFTVDAAAFWGSTDGTLHLLNMILSGYMIKMLFALLGVFPSWLLVRKLKSVDNVDFYDIKTNFNPFSLKLR